MKKLIDLLRDNGISMIVLPVVALFFIACESKTDKFESMLEDKNRANPIVETKWDPDGSGASETEFIEEVIEPKEEPVAKVSSLNDRVEENQKEGYVFQVGAFLNENNAIRLLEKLRKKEYPAYIKMTQARGKQWNLVRVGPWDGRNQALSVAEAFTIEEQMEVMVLHNSSVIGKTKLATKAPDVRKQKTVKKTHKPKVEAQAKAKDKKASVADNKPEPLQHEKANTDSKSKPEKKRVAKIVPKKEASETKAIKPFSFQIGGLYSAENAKKYLEIYQNKGYAPYLLEVKDEISGDIWYSIRIGRFASMKEAVDAAADFSAKEDMIAQARPIE